MFGATYFNEQIDNLIVAVFTPVDTAVNVGSAHIQGVETTLTLHPARWLRPAGQLDLHRCAERRYRLAPAAPAADTPRRSMRRITPIPA